MVISYQLIAIKKVATIILITNNYLFLCLSSVTQ